MKFFAFDLSVQYSFKNNKHTLGSARSATELQKLLDIFIDKFIVCGSCGNPETVLRISKNQLVLYCKACGYKTVIQYIHRVTDYIEKKIILENKEKKKIKKVIPKNQNPIDSLKTFWRLDPKDTEIIAQIQEFQEDNKLDNEQLITNIFESLFGDKNIFSLLEQKCKIYRLFKDKEQFQQITLYSIEKLCEKEESLLPSIVNLLQHFLQKKLLTQEELIHWHNNPRIDISNNISQPLEISPSLWSTSQRMTNTQIIPRSP